MDNAFLVADFAQMASNALSSAVGGVLAAATLAGAGILFRTYLRDLWDAARLRPIWSLPSRAASELSPAAIRRSLLKLLRDDQSRTGAHYGQFGQGQDLEKERQYHNSAEDIRAKPRMYFTFWPVKVLTAHQELQASVRYATSGVGLLLRNGRVLVFQAVQPGMHPGPVPPIISYRHTISAALIIQTAIGWTHDARNVLGAMLDSGEHWQSVDGGWAHCDRQYTESDLYGSAYAALFLHAAVESSDLTRTECSLAAAALSKTLEFLRGQWRKDQWKGEITTERNATYILVLVAPLLEKFDRPLLNEIVGHLRTWLTPTGHLTDRYVERCSGTSHLALYAHLAYCFYRSGIDKQDWLPLFVHALRHFGEAANAAEWAFLLDMTYVQDNLHFVN